MCSELCVTAERFSGIKASLIFKTGPDFLCSSLVKVWWVRVKTEFMLLCQIIVSLPMHDKKGDGGMGQGKTASKMIQQMRSRGTMTWHVSLQPGSHQWLPCLSVWQGENQVSWLPHGTQFPCALMVHIYYVFI